MHKEGMRQSFAKAPITGRTGLRVSRVVPGEGVYALNGEGGDEFIPADTIVYAMGMRPNSQTVEELWDTVPDTVAVGDCVKARKARNAMEEGYWAAVNLA
jgi:pyruvate/2-oxoglutarate dehydrogenase complex dihydrolipoamide dehydrogenase (E3) component